MDMALVYEAFGPLPRQGPGSLDTTRKAYGLLRGLPSRPRILDVGCGTGDQTVELARLSRGLVVGLDNHHPYLEALDSKARSLDGADGIQVVRASMFDLSFRRESFDVIWAEGSVYLMGVEEALKRWREFLKPGGSIALSDAVWLRKDAPEEVRAFFAEEYPEMKTDREYVEAIRDCGFSPVSQFVLPESDWWDQLYFPLERELEVLSRKYADDAQKLASLAEMHSEIDLYRRYSDCYGYAFYIMKSG